MKRIAIRLAILFFVASSTAQLASSQTLSVAGNWEITVRMPDKNVSEQWVIEQKGDKITGMAKGPAGEMHALEGELNGVVFRVDSRNGDVYKVRATVEEDTMDGSVTMGNKEYLWSAKRSKS